MIVSCGGCRAVVRQHHGCRAETLSPTTHGVGLFFSPRLSASLLLPHRLVARQQTRGKAERGMAISRRAARQARAKGAEDRHGGRGAGRLPASSVPEHVPATQLSFQGAEPAALSATGGRPRQPRLPPQVLEGGRHGAPPDGASAAQGWPGEPQFIHRDSFPMTTLYKPAIVLAGEGSKSLLQA